MKEIVLTAILVSVVCGFLCIACYMEGKASGYCLAKGYEYSEAYTDGGFACLEKHQLGN